MMPSAPSSRRSAGFPEKIMALPLSSFNRFFPRTDVIALYSSKMYQRFPRFVYMRITGRSLPRRSDKKKPIRKATRKVLRTAYMAPITFPIQLFGTRSPYPTVVSVIREYQAASPSESISGAASDVISDASSDMTPAAASVPCPDAPPL